MVEKKIVSMWAAIGFFVLLGFQNCSKIAVLDTASENPSMAVQGDGSTPDPTTQISNPADPGGSGSMPHPGPVVDTNHPKDPPGSTTPPVPGSTPSSPGHPVASGGDDHGDCNHPPSQPGSPSTPAPDDDDDHVGSDESDAAALCMAEEGHNLKGFGAISVVSGSSETDIHGSYLFEVTSLKLLNDAHGKIIIVRGKDAAATIDEISDAHGALILCGVTVGSILSSTGSLILVNSRVNLINDHHGNIRVMNSQIGSTHDLHGGSIKQISKN